MMNIKEIFKKKSDDQGEIDRIIQENVTGQVDTDPDVADHGATDYDPVNFREDRYDEGNPGVNEMNKNRTGDQDIVIKKLSLDIDKLKAQVEAFSQIRKINDERLQRISEEIGDLRRGGLEREKNINKLRLESGKACDLVSSVQPEKFMIELNKTNAKIERLLAMQKAHKELIDFMTAETKNIKTDVKAFRGTESLIKLNEEVKGELIAIKRVQSTVEKHADKVENIFIGMQKRFNQFLKFSGEMGVLENEFKDVLRDVDKFKLEFKNLADKGDLAKLEKTVEKKLGSVDCIGDDIRKAKTEFMKVMDDSGRRLKEIDRLEKTLKNRISELDGELSRLARMGQKRYVTEEKINKELEDIFSNITVKLDEHKNEIEKKIRKIEKENKK